MPPALEDPILIDYGINASTCARIRSATDRPEIGLHTVYLNFFRPQEGLSNLVRQLHDQLKSDERILVFFTSTREADVFAESTGCAVYHSKLPDAARSKVLNLEKWDQGILKVMACSPAMAQGVDRANVRFVVIYKPGLSLQTVMQMTGRAGRDGRESHVFFVEYGQNIPPRNPDDHRLLHELGQVVHEKMCKVFLTTKFMDGETLAYRCKDRPGRVPCSFCKPDSEIHLLAKAAVQDPPPTPAVERNRARWCQEKGKQVEVSWQSF